MMRKTLLLSLLFGGAVFADHHIPGEVSGGIDCTDALNQVIYPECQVTATPEPTPEPTPTPEPVAESCTPVFHTDEGRLEIAWADVGSDGYDQVVLNLLSMESLTFQLGGAQPADAAAAPAAECRATFDPVLGEVSLPRVDLHGADGEVSASYANVLLRLTDPSTLTFQVTGADPVQ